MRAVLENAPCPVAIAPRGHASHAPALRKIAAAFDGSAESEQALALARVLARERGAELSAFQAVPDPGYVHSIVNPQPEIEAGLAEARKRIAELGDVDAHAASNDDAAEALARYGASVDLLVLGSHRYRPVDHLLSGAPPSGWPTMPRARCSCWRRNDLTPGGSEASSAVLERGPALGQTSLVASDQSEPDARPGTRHSGARRPASRPARWRSPSSRS